MTTAPSPQNSPIPLATESAHDAGAEQLFRLIQLGFDRPLVLRLKRLPGIDIARAETELRLLDLFAVYFAIKTSGCERWKGMEAALFERVCTRVLTWWAPAWDTEDDVIEVLKGRFAAYNHLAEAAGPADLESVSLLLGVLCAVMIQGGGRVFAGHANKAGEAFTNSVVDLMEEDNLLRTTAATILRTRFDSVSALFLTFGS